jgi:phenylalanine ammonia-lyase
MINQRIPTVPLLSPPFANGDNGHEPAVVVDGESLTIEKLVTVATHGAKVCLTDRPDVLHKMEASCRYVEQAVAAGRPIYGVTTGFGGMANIAIPKEEMAELQNNIIWYHKTGAGKRLPKADVRAAMLLRINSHLRGASGIRLLLVERMVTFLNANVIPHVHEFGSIGASGDLVPLSYICGSLIGLDHSFRVDFNGEEVSAITALERLGLKPIQLRQKEGLAMINGTSFMTAIAANCVYQARKLLVLALGSHALLIQALRGTNQSFHPFIHAHKPHPGQRWAAQNMVRLLDGSQLIRDEFDGECLYNEDELIQDRYSLRCLPQYMGPIVDGLAMITRQIEVEMNSTSDNPLIDGLNEVSYHGGNFLGQYVGMAMDHLRYYLGLLAKHLDVQIALLVAPEFNNGLPPSLRGNSGRPVNMGLKGLQIAANSIMPLLTFLGNSLADRFPSHAEQFNQNINSQGFGSANLARQSIETFNQYMAIALIFTVQAVDLRAHLVQESYDARPLLSPASRPLYQAVRTAIDSPPSASRPYLWDDNERPLDRDIATIAADIAAGGPIFEAACQALLPFPEGE